MMVISDDHDDNDNDEEDIAGGAGDDNVSGSESPFSGTFAERMNEGLAELAITWIISGVRSERCFQRLSLSRKPLGYYPP
jgi:hypothetical protein